MLTKFTLFFGVNSFSPEIMVVQNFEHLEGLVDERIANIGIPLDIFAFCGFSGFLRSEICLGFWVFGNHSTV